MAALKRNRERELELKEKVEDINSFVTQKIVVKAWLGFKYNLLM
jgi:hypothetical protein